MIMVMAEMLMNLESWSELFHYAVFPLSTGQTNFSPSFAWNLRMDVKLMIAETLILQEPLDLRSRMITHFFEFFFLLKVCSIASS